MNNQSLFYRDRPLFGLDIGFKSVKAMQLEPHNKGYQVAGYGVNSFNEQAVKNGVIVDYETLAQSINELFSSKLVGQITTRRAAFSVPASKTFSRILNLPLLAKKDLSDAIRLEAEQYIPLPIDELYIDFSIISKTAKDMQVLVVAIPKKIVDSYLNLASILNLEVVVMESTISSTNRLFRYTDQHNVPSVLIDFGSVSADITVYDDNLQVTGTVPGGGDDITQSIAEKLGVTKDEAHLIKLRYGLGVSKKQSEITEAVSPILQKTVKELKRMVRYYEERTDQKRKIGQIVTFGGGANVPGLSEFLTDSLRLPVRACDPWHHLSFRPKQEPPEVERSMYITAASLGLVSPKEIFDD